MSTGDRVNDLGANPLFLEKKKKTFRRARKQTVSKKYCLSFKTKYGGNLQSVWNALINTSNGNQNDIAFM